MKQWTKIKLKFYFLMVSRGLFALGWLYKIYFESGPYTTAFCLTVFLWIEIFFLGRSADKEERNLKDDIRDLLMNQIKNQN